MSVHGLATFAWDAGDEAGRRLAAVQLVRLRAASQAQVAAGVRGEPGHGVAVGPGAGRGRGGRSGPGPAGDRSGASKLTPELAARIRELDAAGATLAADRRGDRGVDVHASATRWAGSGRRGAACGGQGAEDSAGLTPAADGRGRAERGGCRCCRTRCPGTASGRWPGGGCWARAPRRCSPPGARYPLAGLLLALPALEDTGLLDAARQVYGRLRDGFYGLAATLLTLVFLALAGEPRAEGATRVPPGGAGPGARAGPGAGGQDDPPQAGRARRRREGRGPDHGAGPPPRRGPAGHAGVRACQIFCVSWGSRCPFVMLVGSFSVPGQTGTRSPNATANAFMAAFQP